MLLQLEEDHMPGTAELCSLSDLDWPEGKTNDPNLSHAHTHTENIKNLSGETKKMQLSAVQ